MKPKKIIITIVSVIVGIVIVGGIFAYAADYDLEETENIMVEE